MVMVFEGMVENAMVYMVGADEVFECARTLFGGGFDFVGCDGGEGDGLEGGGGAGYVVVDAFDGWHECDHGRRHLGLFVLKELDLENKEMVRKKVECLFIESFGSVGKSEAEMWGRRG